MLAQAESTGEPPLMHFCGPPRPMKLSRLCRDDHLFCWMSGDKTHARISLHQEDNKYVTVNWLQHRVEVVVGPP